MTGIFRWVHRGCVATSLAAIACALHFWGATEVRTQPGELLFLTLLGGFWGLLASRLFAWLGLSLRDDAIERRNVGALVALCGAELGVTVTYVGGSAGEGPSYWNNIFSAGLSTSSLFLVWMLLELTAKASRSIAEERDVAAGVRLGGFLLAASLVLGRAAAGDWHSELATVHDFVEEGWPVLILGAGALITERVLRPSRRHPFPPWPSCGLVPALLYLAFAALWLWHLGPWEGMP